MNFYRYRSNYWSCSCFADWILSFVEVVKPESETIEGWKLWKKIVVTNHPWIYKFVEQYLDKIQDIVLFPYDVYDNFRIYLRNRFVTRVHLLDTKLEPGEWHETDTRMLHGMFELLVDFIEVEKAHMTNWSKPKKERPWFLKWRILRWGEYRSREDGLSYLEWEMTLMEDDIHQSKQALAAKEQYDLYIWWKDIRPTRPDPYKVTGWHKLNDSIDPNNEFNGGDNINFNRNELCNLSQEVFKLEESWHQEDDEMLIRLVKIRRTLWT